MAFTRFSSEHLACSSILVDNQFFKNYLFDIPDEYLKIYLYGLYLISNHLESENNAQVFCQKLKIDEKHLIDAFTFLENLGLVEIVSASPFEVKYLELKDAAKHKKINPEKYSDFSLQVQKVLSERMINPNEFSEYYAFIETYKMEPSALVMLMKYCTNIKGLNVSYKYILAVATDWAKKGILTVDKVTDELSQRERLKSDIEKILTALKVKRLIENEDNVLYLKWTKEYGFDTGSILFACTLLKTKKNVYSLDKLLQEFFAAKAFSQTDMQELVRTKENIKNLATSVVKDLGLYYENLEPVITYYIKPWTNMGFAEEGLKLITRYCDKKNMRSLDRMNDVITSLFTQGIVQTDSIKNHIVNISARDKKLADILLKAGISCQVNKWHRENYTTWSEQWGLPDDLIEHAAGLAHGKVNPIAYMNATLSNFKQKGIFKMEDAVKEQNGKSGMYTHNYSEEELSKLIDDIDSIEI